MSDRRPDRGRTQGATYGCPPRRRSPRQALARASLKPEESPAESEDFPLGCVRDGILDSPAIPPMPPAFLRFRGCFNGLLGSVGRVHIDTRDSTLGAEVDHYGGDGTR